jgi:hypothetical protein
MIRNKPYLEVNFVLNCFPEASNVGYVLLPIVLKLAIDYGMKPFTEVLNAWEGSDLKKAKVYQSVDEAVNAGAKVMVNWEGKSVEEVKGTFVIGLKSLLKEIEYNVLAAELKRAGKELLEMDDTERAKK